jgi:hypothetical protein
VSREPLHDDATRAADDRASLDSPGPDTVLRVNVPGYGLGALLMSIASRGLSGQLSLVTDVGRRTIHLHSGLPVFAQSSLVSERLGAVGVRHGFFTREDVARALAHGREQELELGQGLLDLGVVDPARLFALLGVQVREIIAAACGSAPQRARLSTGNTSRDVMMLRLHPLTAVLMAISALPAVERAKLLAELASERLVAEPLPSIARDWLIDLGYLGELNALSHGELTLASLRTRLRARYRAGAEKVFDPSRSPFAAPGSRELCVLPPSAGGVADMVALTLLVSISMRLVATSRHAAGAEEPLANTASGLHAWLARASEHGTDAELLPYGAPPTAPADRAIERYLRGERERSLALASAVWGPSVEASDPAMPYELLRLYVTLRSHPSAAAVLGVALDEGADGWMQGYARRSELLSSLAGPDASSLVRCRVAELRRRCDDALDSLVSGTQLARPSAMPTSSLAGVSSPGSAAAPTAARESRQPGQAARESRHPSQAPRNTEPSRRPAEPDPRANADALVSRVEGLMRAGHWGDVQRVLSAPSAQPLSFTLQLARAMAQRELSRKRTLVAPALLLLVLGVVAGVLLRHFVDFKF